MPQKSMIKYGKIDLESVEKEVEKQAWLTRLVETRKIEADISWKEKGEGYW
jgi:hypothetical protein